MTGTELIAAERGRQITEEGRTPEHDSEHDDDDLAFAAACYALPSTPLGHRVGMSGRLAQVGAGRVRSVPAVWPWEADAWKPTPNDRVRELVKAGALIAAEIDRLQANT